MGSTSVPPLPPIPPAPTPPSRSDDEIAEANREERRRRARAQGRPSTILGGTVGSPQSVSRTSILGG